MSETTRKTYWASQLEALYRTIFKLQTDAGWQDEPDYTAWYKNHGWSQHRPRDTSEILGIPVLGFVGKTPHAIIQAKVERLREEMQAGRWVSQSSEPITVMADGEVMDGHHRLAAASEMDWATVPNDLTFAVVFRPDVMP